MNYDESKIKIEYIIIDGKSVPLYRVPPEMSGPSEIRFYDNEEDEIKDEEEDLKYIKYDDSEECDESYEAIDFQ